MDRQPGDPGPRGGYAINASMGIAERENPVDNAAFTNMGAVVVLREAVRVAQTLGLEADPAWTTIAESLHIPMRGKAVISHDAYRTDEEKGATPDPLMGLFPFGFPLDADHERATLDIYLGLAQDYIGSPMLSALYGVWAARAGDRSLALKLMEDGYGAFASARFPCRRWSTGPTVFPEQPQAGPFFANIGGFLTGLLFGFRAWNRARKTIPQSWARRQANLAAGWTADRRSTVFGSAATPARLTARQELRRV